MLHATFSVAQLLITVQYIEMSHIRSRLVLNTG